MKRLTISIAIFLTFFLSSCSMQPNKLEQVKISPTPYDENIEAYFPLTKGSTWQYTGQGNEYASFSRKVLYTKDNRAQVVGDNGGTRSASIFKTTKSQIVRVFFEGEQYNDTNLLDIKDTENKTILQAPIKTGNRWENPDGTREIVAVDVMVETPAGNFEDCIKVKISSQDTNSTMYEYFKKGIGMVKREFISGDLTVTSLLEKYNIEK